MKKTHKFEINALNVIKSILTIIIIIVLGNIINDSNSKSDCDSSNSGHSKDNNNKIASVSTFGALEEMLFGGNNSNSNNKSNNNTYSNINYNTAKQETESKIKIERCRSKQHGYTNNSNNSRFTNYTPVTKINEIIKNVQSADCPTTVSSTATTTIMLPTPTSSSTRISQSSNEQTAASWSSVALKRIDNSNSNSYGIINIRNSNGNGNGNGKRNKTNIGVGSSKVFGDLHQVRLFNEKDLAHGIQKPLNLNLPPSLWGKMAAAINKRQRTKRFIIFDGNGVVKLIIGGSIPIKLISKQRSLTNIFNLQMQYTPPPIPLYWWSFYNTTTFAARSVEQEVPVPLPNDASRSFLYAVIEKILESKGIPGTECLLKVNCIIAQQPLESGNVFHEILNAIFIPVVANIERKYLDAQVAGRYGVDCTQTFAKCPKNMDWLNGITLATL